MLENLRRGRLASLRERKQRMKAELKRAKHQLQSEIMQSKLRNKGGF